MFGGRWWWLEGGGAAGEMFNDDSQHGQTDGQIDCLCSDR